MQDRVETLVTTKLTAAERRALNAVTDRWVGRCVRTLGLDRLLQYRDRRGLRDMAIAAAHVEVADALQYQARIWHRRDRATDAVLYAGEDAAAWLERVEGALVPAWTL